MSKRILVAGCDPVPGRIQRQCLKNLVVFLILGTGLATADRDRLVLVAGALFSVPFILFSMTGGFLADRFSKRTVTIGTKFFEIAVMLLAAAGLAWQNLHLEMAAIFLASSQAAFLDHRNMDCCQNCCPNQNSLGAMALLNWEPFSQL